MLAYAKSAIIELAISTIILRQTPGNIRQEASSREMQLTLTEAARSVGDDASVQSVVFTGGLGKLFSAGGDFNEVQLLKAG
jgi:enoyl-CoA hydratase/carnithine racemase